MARYRSRRRSPAVQAPARPVLRSVQHSRWGVTYHHLSRLLTPRGIGLAILLLLIGASLVRAVLLPHLARPTTMGTPPITPDSVRAPSAGSTVPAPGELPAASAVAGDAVSTVEQVIQGYNQASMRASREQAVQLLDPYVVPGSPAAQALAGSYAELIARHERLDVRLTRLAFGTTTIRDQTAWVTSQEEWSVLRSRGDAIVVSAPAQVVRNQYMLHQNTAGQWQIWTIESEVLQ